MAKNMQPIAKRCHALGNFSYGHGISARRLPTAIPAARCRKKKGEYALQLAEKQKVKFVYGILERQFRYLL